MDELKCPRCGSNNIEEDEVFDISSTPFDCTEHVLGHCVDCGAKIIYDRVYNFAGYQDIELDEG